MKFIIALLFLVIATTAHAGATNYNRAQFFWSWTQPGGAPADSFQLACGPAEGNYPLVIQVPIAARVQAVSTILPRKNAVYFCVIRAIGQDFSSYSAPKRVEINGNWVYY